MVTTCAELCWTNRYFQTIQTEDFFLFYIGRALLLPVWLCEKTEQKPQVRTVADGQHYQYVYSIGWASPAMPTRRSCRTVKENFFFLLLLLLCVQRQPTWRIYFFSSSPFSNQAEWNVFDKKSSSSPASIGEKGPVDMQCGGSTTWL